VGFSCQFEAFDVLAFWIEPTDKMLGNAEDRSGFFGCYALSFSCCHYFSLSFPYRSGIQITGAGIFCGCQSLVQ